MSRPIPRREVIGVRLTELDKARLEFWAAIQKRSTGAVSSELLSRAINGAILADAQKALAHPTDDVEAADEVAA